MSDQPPYPPQGPPPGQYPPGGQYPSQYPPPQPGTYGSYPQQPKSGNGMAVAALILGILAILSCWTIVGGILLGLIGAVLGFVGLSRAKKVGSGSGMAITGVILSLLGIIAAIVLVVVGVGLFNSVGGKDYIDCVNDAKGDQSAIQQCDDEFRKNIEERIGTSIPT